MTEQETYSAKQVARRIGTDAKTFRKWLRSTASPYPSVGQGQRYEFPVSDLEKIQKSFTGWKGKSNKLPPINGKATRKTKAPKVDREPGEHRGIPLTPPLKRRTVEQEVAVREAARDEVYEEELDGPGPLDMDELEELDLDLEDLELDEDE